METKCTNPHLRDLEVLYTVMLAQQDMTEFRRHGTTDEEQTVRQKGMTGVIPVF